MLARHICQFPFQICPVPQCVWQYHVRFPTTYIHRLGGIVPVSVLGGDSDRHSLAGLICRLVAFRSCTFCCLEPWMTCFHWCAGLKMSIFVWKCWGCLMFGAGAASHDFQSSCDPSTSVPFGAQLPLHWCNIWCTLAWSRIFFFGPALETAKFGTFWPPISMKQAYCASTSMQKNLRKLRFRARNRNFCPAGRCCFPRSGHSFHGQHLSVLQFATCVMGAVEWLPRLNDWSGYGQTLRCAYPMEVHQFSRNIYDTRVACEIGCIGFSCGSVVMLLCNILAPEFMQKSMEDQLRELFRGTSQSGCLPSRDLLQSLCLNGEPSFRMCHCSFIEITMAWLPFSNLKIVL